LQVPVVTDFLALSAATYCGTSAEAVACAATPLAPDPVAGAAGELLHAASSMAAAAAPPITGSRTPLRLLIMAISSFAE
jgi:hypothetical protein